MLTKTELIGCQMIWKEILDKMNETLLIYNNWLVINDIVSMYNRSKIKIAIYDSNVDSHSMHRTKMFQLGLPNYNCFRIEEHLQQQMRHWIFILHISPHFKKVMQIFSEFGFMLFWQRQSDFRDDFNRGVLSRNQLPLVDKSFISFLNLLSLFFLYGITMLITVSVFVFERLWFYHLFFKAHIWLNKLQSFSLKM